MKKQFSAGLAVISLITMCGCGSSSSEGGPSGPTAPSGQSTVTSLTISGSAFTLVGHTTQLTATAHLSNGTTQTATNSATWQSSNPGVATVSSLGMVTTATPGTATITASYGGQSGALALTVSNAASGAAKVRVLYAIPQDRSFRADYAAAVQNAMVDLRLWYLQQLAGSTFSLFNPQPETCLLPHAATYYPGGTYTKVLNDAQGCAPVSPGTSTAWVVYADLEDGCNDPGRLGVGSPGLTILGSGDLKGLVGAQFIDSCGVEHRFPVGRYIGGAGHELGHAFGLSHPPGCDAGLPTCDSRALMWSGYSLYPNTYLRDDEKVILRNSQFFR